MDKLFSKKRNRLAYLLIVYLPFIIPMLTSLIFDYPRGSNSVTVGYLNDIAQQMFFLWYKFLLPTSTVCGILMLLTGWYKEIRKIEQDNSYSRWLASITIILNILIVVGLAALNS